MQKQIVFIIPLTSHTRPNQYYFPCTQSVLLIRCFRNVLYCLVARAVMGSKFFCSFQFVKFANIEEDTPSYHRSYDFFVSRFSEMCHSSYEDPDIRTKWVCFRHNCYLKTTLVYFVFVDYFKKFFFNLSFVLLKIDICIFDRTNITFKIKKKDECQG